MNIVTAVTISGVTAVTPNFNCDGRHSHFEIGFSHGTNLQNLVAIALFNPKITLVSQIN